MTGFVGVWGEACQMVIDLTEEGCDTIDGGQRLLHVWQGCTLAISVEEVQHGGFLSGGTQEIAIVHQVFKEKGQAIVSATRRPNTPGVSGSGTLIGIVVKALAPGSSNLSIVQVNAKDSQQKLIPLITSEAALQVQP